ncbi:MAG TPA: cytochrome P450 [Acidimicrobiia bacterium]|nr:cytochrome P450 [Acidimicrobiia bacterium]
MTTTDATAVTWPAWEDAAFYMQEPAAMYASIGAERRAAPVYWYEPPGYPTGLWVLSKWEHQRYVGSHPELFSSRYGFAIGDASDPSTVMHQLPEWAQRRIREGNLGPAETRRAIAHGKLSMGDPDFESLMISDPPRHGQIRNVLMKALRPSLVRSLKGRIAEIADTFVAELEPGVETDFVTTIGRIPAALMTELIGVPRDMRERFIEMSSAQMQAITIDPNRDPAEAERIQGLVGEFHAYCDELLAERRASGADGDDLASIIARSEFDGGPVPSGMAISYIHTFVNAGETTRSLLSFVAMALAEHPDQRRLLVERPELVANAVEETLRCYPLNWSGCRTATRDLELGGQQIHEDDYVMMAYASANRDEDVWDRPDEYDVTRSFDMDHQSFGYGEHSCPGALLARTDSAIVFERLLARFPHWELAAVPQRWANPFLQGLSTLPVRFTP